MVGPSRKNAISGPELGIVATAFQSAFDQLAEHSDANPAKILFGLDSS